jgi:hypothetical protein
MGPEAKSPRQGLCVTPGFTVAMMSQTRRNPTRLKVRVNTRKGIPEAKRVPIMIHCVGFSWSVERLFS